MSVFRSLFVAGLFVFVFAGLAPAQDWGKVMTPDRPLNVRAERSLNARRITTIMPGESVRMDFLKGDWAAVFPLSVTERSESKAIGFVKAKYLKPAGTVKAAAWGKLLAPRGMLNVRKGRDRGSEHVVTLREGEVVKADFEKDGWFAIFPPDAPVRDEARAMGYARSKYLFPAAAVAVKSSVAAPAESRPVEPEPAETKPAEPQSAEPEFTAADLETASKAGTVVVHLPPDAEPVTISEPEPETAPVHVVPTAAPAPPQAEDDEPGWGRVVHLDRRANVRSDRTAGSHLVATLGPGDVVRVDFLQRGWYAVFRPGERRRDLDLAMGYIYAPLLGEPDQDIQIHTLRPAATPATPSPDAMTDTMPDMQAHMQTSTPAASVPTQAWSPDAATTAVQRDGASGKDSMTIVPVDQGAEPHKGPVPRADRVRHGFRYGIFERTEGTGTAVGRLLLKIYLDLSVIPGDESLRDFATTIAKEEKGEASELLLLIYLPGQDTKELSYGQARFDASGMVEFWTRRATLYGTHFLP